MHQQPKYRAVVGLVFTNARNYVTLIRKRRPTWQAGKLNGIGGLVRWDETYAEAIGRTAREEAGFGDLKWKLFSYRRGANEVGEVTEVAYFSAFTDDPPKMLTDETVKQYPVEIIANLNVIPDLKYLVPAALDETVCLMEVLAKW